jgi:hypothetical protein
MNKQPANQGRQRFFGGALALTQGANPTSIGAAAAHAMSDFFAAAQFIEMSQDDKLSKPSFESYTAGYQLASADFDMGEIIPEPLGYEEADLGALPVTKIARRRAGGEFSKRRTARCWPTAPVARLRDRAHAARDGDRSTPRRSRRRHRRWRWPAAAACSPACGALRRHATV